MYSYSAEKNVLQLIALLKAHNIKKFVVSPGTTNVCLVASLQQDDFFELYSSVDERSAAYIACGLAEESGEPVALSCTGATASRNYFSGLTEAYYRKLPILAITSSRSIGQIGQNIDQVTDRTQLPNDIVVRSVLVPVPDTKDQEWENNVKINTALIDLRRRGGGPVHINLITRYTKDFSVKSLPKERVIRYYTHGDVMPQLVGKTVGVFVGAHKKWSDKLTKSVDLFCKKFGAVVLYEPGSNYHGEYGVPYNLVHWQKGDSAIQPFDVMIHIGDIAVFGLNRAKEIWRVNPDGEVRDTFRKLTAVFEMDECIFFGYFNQKDNGNSHAVANMYSLWKERHNELTNLAEQAEIPFSNVWVAMQSRKKLPIGAELHLGILNSVRSWTLLTLDSSNDIFCNTGGYGIDGVMSSLIGASLADSNKLYFGILGDLSFFYDMNSLGNRHVGNNLRIMVINNGMGGEFKNHMNLAQRSGIGEDANWYISAAGHYGNKSKELIKSYSTALGFKYLSAEDADSFSKNAEEFFNPSINESMVFEVFTSDKNDDAAISIMQSLDQKTADIAKDKAKDAIKSLLGDGAVKSIKKALGK